MPCAPSRSDRSSTPQNVSQLEVTYDTFVEDPNHTGKVGDTHSFAIYAPTTPTQLILSASVVPFGTQTLGGIAIPRVVTITNTGNTVVTAPTLSVPGVSDYIISQNRCVSPLASHESCLVAVQFNPATTGVRNAKLNVASGTETVQATLMGSGRLDSPVQVSPLEIGWYEVVVGRSWEQKLILSNASDAAVDIASITFSMPDFSAVNDCQNRIPPQGTCNISVTFAPQELGRRDAAMTLNFSGQVSRQLVNMTSATGIPPLLIVNPSVNFGLVLVKATTSQYLQFGNGKEIAVAYTLSLSGSDFAITNNPCPNPMPAYRGCALTVNFNPLTAGQKDGTITIGYPGLSIATNISLSGIGVERTTVNLDNALDFGTRALASTIGKTITITNTGTSIL